MVSVIVVTAVIVAIAVMILRVHSCHVLPFQPILWNRYFPSEPAKQPITAPNLFQRGVEYGKYVVIGGPLGRLGPQGRAPPPPGGGRRACFISYASYVYIYIYRERERGRGRESEEGEMYCTCRCPLSQPQSCRREDDELPIKAWRHLGRVNLEVAGLYV